MTKDNPLVSIITATYNSEKTIADSIESLLTQDYLNIELIVIDGKSLDNTIKIIESYKNTLKRKNILFKFLSEKDNGIGDAWNKGLKLASGEIIAMLNSDDWFETDSVSLAVKILNPNMMELSYGICKRVNNKKSIIQIVDREFKPKRIYLNFGFSHTTCFVTKKTFEEIGCFDTSYRIAIDTDFLLRCYKGGVKFKRAKNITYMRLGGISNKYKKNALLEYEKALKLNGYNVFLTMLYGLIKRVFLLLNER